MKYCEDFAALLDPFVDGELTPDEMARVQAHLDECPACRAYVDDALAIRGAFPDVEETEVPEGFAEGVMARIQTEASSGTATPAHKQTSRPWLKPLASLAACCAIVLLAAPMFSGGAKMKAAPDAAAAPAMTTESASEETADAPAEEPAAMMDRQITFDSGAVTEHAAPAEYGGPQEAEKAAGPYAYTASGTVYAFILTLPPEGAELMADDTPVSESGTEVRYELTAREAEALLAKLEHASFSYQREEGIDPTTDLVLVILSK